jgi:hypothetical protein
MVDVSSNLLSGGPASGTVAWGFRGASPEVAHQQPARIPGVSALVLRQVSRHPSRRQQVADEGLDPVFDVVTDGAYLIDALSGGVVELPVFVALAGVVRAGVARPRGGPSPGRWPAARLRGAARVRRGGRQR